MPPEWTAAAVDGMRAALGEPVALLAVLALALAALAEGAGRSAAAAGLFALAAGASHWLPPSPAHTAVAAGLLALLGARLAAGWRPALPLRQAEAAAGGLAFGLAAGVPLATGTEAAGSLSVAAALLALLLFIGVPLHHRGAGGALLRWGPRVVGAWLAAIGLLLTALQLWGRRG
jgi:hypothetical protein